jgi:hypothetical protein
LWVIDMSLLLDLEPLEQRTLLSGAHLAVIGDFSSDTQIAPTRDVANLVKSWSPDAVVTVGDNNYPDGGADTIDANIGQWYQQFIYPYSGKYGAGSADGVNHFWPAVGNHDWTPTGSVKPYTDYFTLPNNERYYDVQIGNVGVFVIDSDSHEPDGTSATSTQANYIKSRMLASTAKWKIVIFHHPAYTSGGEGNNTYMRWPFASWGATAVISGHDHDYERLLENGLPYFVDGLGGESIVGFGATTSGSQVRYDGDYGAMRVDATDTSITFQFITRTGKVIDTYTAGSTTTPPPAPSSGLINSGDTWKYLDNGSNQGTAWRATAFNDSAWKTGSSQLGYGDGDEATVVGYGSNASNKFVTTYFRRSFSVTNPASITSLQLQLLRDDGAVVYLNGQEIVRSNMPSSTVAYNTLASTAIGGADESAWYSYTVNPAMLVAGTNVIAVEIHQAAVDSSDISFDLKLTASTSSSTPTTSNLIAPGASWRYLDNGSNQGTAWSAASFSDSTWKSGKAQLGYGDGDEATVVGFGPSSTNKFVTTYFRNSFNVIDPSTITSLTAQMIRDDGAVVYLNGKEVWRSNMPTGTIGYRTLASVAVGGTDESKWFSASIPTSALLAGTNVIAVEIHQSDLDSSDISFDFQLAATLTSSTTTMAAATTTSTASLFSTKKVKSDNLSLLP